MIIEISVAIAALAFVILVIFLVLTLIDLRKTLHKTNQTLQVMETRVDPMLEEALALIKNTKNITSTLNDHLQAVNPLMDSIHDVGTVVHDAASEFANGSIRKSLRRETKKTRWTSKVIEFLELSAHALNVWQQMKRGR